MAVLRYGTDSSVDLELNPPLVPAEYGTQAPRPLDDPALAVAEALWDPLEYPPLHRMTTPGDHVVLALQRDLPQAAQITEAVVYGLLNANVDPDGIAVLQPPGRVDGNGEEPETDDPCRLLPWELRARIVLATHDPESREHLAYLAANDAGEPILLHRAIHDADLVLPIGSLHGRQAAGYFGIHGLVYPAFSDPKTLRRFRSLASLQPESKLRRSLLHEVDQVAWLLGINFTIQLVPGPGDSVLHVLAGQSEAVRRRGGELYEQAWGCRVSRRAKLVVAAVEGDSSQQTWENLGRALDAAMAMVEEGGSIAVCCDLAASPGPGMQRIAGARSRDAALRRIRKDRPADALPAAQLARALDRGKVYLLSRLDPSVVEELDMIHLASPAELRRLVRRHSSCILLSNAPRAMPMPG